MWNIRFRKAAKFIFVFINFVIVSSCGGGGSSGPANNNVPLLNKTVYWDHVTLYTDNAQIPDANRTIGYEIFVNQSGVFSDSDTVASVPSGQNSWLLNLMQNPQPAIKYYAWVKSVDYNSNPPIKSDNSGRVEFYFDR